MIKDWRKQWYWALWVFLLLPLLFVNVPDFHDWGGDFAMYIIQAINLVEGHPQSATGYIYNPDFINNGPPNYPIGFSLLLAPVYAIWGNDMGAFQLLQAWLAFGFGLVFFAYAKQHISWWASLLLVVIMVYNPWFLGFKREIMSEFSFLVFTMIFLMAADRKWWLLAFVSGVMVVLTRAIGWLVIPTILTVLVFNLLKERSWEADSTKMVGLMIAIICTVQILDGVVFKIESSVSAYSDQLVEFNLFTNAWNNLVYLKDNWSYHMVEFFQKWGLKSSLPFVAFAVLSLVGAVKVLKSYPHQVWFYLGYVGVLLIYPFTGSGFRFLFPLVCFALVLSAVGLISITPRFKGRAIVFVLLTVLYMSTHLDKWKHTLKYEEMVLQGPQHEDSVEAFEHIMNETSEDEPILFLKPRVLALYTGRRSAANHPRCEEAQIQKLMKEHEISLLLTNKFLGNSALDTFIVHHRQDLDLEFSNNSFKMYRLKQ